MPEKCDPYIYYHRVRPYIFGWKNNPDLPDGLIYDGFFQAKPQLFRGETGAVSSIPSLTLFNVHHEKDELRDYLDEMKHTCQTIIEILSKLLKNLKLRMHFQVAKLIL